MNILPDATEQLLKLSLRYQNEEHRSIELIIIET